jgi:uncharacterized membrane protein
VSYFLELLAINTGIFGTYVYTSNLAPFIGEIPLFIPLLWASLSYFCMIASDNYVVAAVLMVLLDMSFDPRFALTLWKWAPPTQYFGVPWNNFAGWFITSLVIFALFYLATRRKPSASKIAIAFYFLLGIDQTLSDTTSGLYSVALISTILFAVASLLIYANYRRMERKRMRLGPMPSQT